MFRHQEEMIGMKKKKHIPPSRASYAKKYPVWPVRMPQEWIEDAELLLKDTEQSRRDLIGVALGKHKADYLKAREEGFKEGVSFGMKIGDNHGYKNAERKYGIWYYCSKCNDIIIMRPNSPDHKALIEYMKKYGWGHESCPRK